MSGASRVGPPGTLTSRPLAGSGRFGARAAVGLVAVLAGAVPFLALLVLVGRTWSAGPDDQVAADLNAFVRGRPALVEALVVLTDGGGTGTSVVLLTLAFGWLALRREQRLAAFVAVTGLGLAVLVPVSKALVGRDRPYLDLPVVGLPTNASFPSGHAMCSLVTYGVLLLLVLPRVSRSLRVPLAAAAAAAVLLVGVTRLALGVHFLTDVLAGYALGIAWLAAMTAAFRAWQHDVDLPAPVLPTGPDRTSTAQRPLPLAPLPGAARAAARVSAAWLAVFAVLVAVGLVVSDRLGVRALGALDTAVARGAVDLRTPELTGVAQAVSALAGTRAILTLVLAQAVLAHAWTRRWWPSVFVVLAAVGEVSLYFVTAQVIGRSRPTVPDLHGELPAAASFPSGHAAAAVAAYGALAVLVLTGSRARWRWWVLAVPVTVCPLVGLSRLYLAAHYLTDVLAGFLLGVLWLFALSLALRLPTPSGPDGAVP